MQIHLPHRCHRSLAARLGSICLLISVASLRAAEVKEAYDDGKPKLHYRTDAQDRKVGVYEEWHPNGRLKIRGGYLAGKKTGQWSTYDDAGKLLQIENYRNDLLDGSYVWNFPSGKPGLRAAYHLGQLDGAITVLDEKGRVTRHISYPRSLEAVRKAFATLYFTEKPPVVFTTEPVLTPPYKAGVLSPPTLQAALKVTKLYRYLSGVAFEDLKIDPVACDKSAHGAVVLTKIGSLTHTPAQPPDMPADFFKLAYLGCHEDNLFMGSGNPVDAVRAFMDDSDESNIDRVGHRQWVLSPGLADIGFGSAQRFVSMYVFGGNRAAHADFNFIAFPGEGFYPRKLVEPHYGWSVHLNRRKAKLGPTSALKITLQKLDEHYQPAGEPIAARIVSTPEEMSPAFNWRTVVFKPEFTELESARYWVEIEGVLSTSGQPAPFGYLVDLIDIERPEEPPAK